MVHLCEIEAEESTFNDEAIPLTGREREEGNKYTESLHTFLSLACEAFLNAQS